MSREAVARAGHFTTVQVRGGRVQGRDLHLARLEDASRTLYGSAPGVSLIRERIRAALREGGMSGGDCTLRVRILPARPGCRAGSPSQGVQALPLRIKIDLEALRDPPSAPLRLRTYAGLRECAGVKHLALDFQLEAKRAAQAAGHDDALLLAADGRISEGTFWNVLFWDGSAAVWPDAPALMGTTWQLLERELARAGVPQRSRAIRVEALGAMRAAFALNSTGIADIAAVDGHVLPGDPAAGRRLRELLADVPWENF